jgi:phosphoglycerol transferase MdoB-like AlkP superfamily enzyme
MRSLVFWTAWFAAARALFYAWHWDKVPKADRGLVLQSFLPGARMDLSAAAYITTLLWLLLTLTVSAPVRITRRLLLAAALVLVPFVATLTLTDIGTFGPWRRRLDAALWTYLASPREAYASAESIALGPLLGVLAVVLVLTAWAYHRVLRRPETQLRQHRGRHAVGAALSVGLTGLLLAIPVRGGLQWTPINESTVYFSRSEMANLGALNASWYLLYSTVAEQETPSTNPFVVMPEATAAAVVDSLYGPGDGGPGQTLLRVAHPNVILIIWESFTAKVVARLGGRPGVTPEFERWSRQGILFDSVFASGDRSAQGLVSILSGFPSIPKVAIMTRPQKAATLPQLGRTLQQAGYQTSFYYGGELAFANMKAYVLGGGFDRVTGIEAFAPAERNSKWGAHDHVVLQRALSEFPGQRRPFFSTIFTLSSHEPFEVPVAPTISGGDLSAKFMNAHHYTDASIGAFLDAASRQPWWDSTLVVIIADHGSPLPEPPPGTQETVLARHHVPMLWLGGALAVRDTVVHRLTSSTDLAPTLLGEVGVDAGAFHWGRNVVRRRGAGGFVWFAHHDGFAFLDRTGWEVFDERAGRTTERSPGAGPGHRRSGSALLQATFADYLAR